MAEGDPSVGPLRRAAAFPRGFKEKRVRPTQHYTAVFPGNDPSAGSPTETLLRLLLPLDSQVRSTFQRTTRAREGAPAWPIRGPHITIQSVVATGGVYKGQGLNQRELMTRTYWEFLVHGE